MGREAEVYLYNGRPFSKKKKEILQFTTNQMNLEEIMRSEINQTEKDKHVE